jgi:hypothetical protein
MLFRCPDCRTRRKDYGLFTKHIKSTGHTLCRCGGYHYQHRPGSKLCERNPLSDVHLAARTGATDEELDEIQMHCLWNKPGTPMRQWPTNY